MSNWRPLWLVFAHSTMRSMPWVEALTLSSVLAVGSVTVAKKVAAPRLLAMLKSAIA